MKITILLLFSLFLTISSRAQNQCDSTAKNALGLFGAKLGMSPEQVRAVFGKDLKIKIKKRGTGTFFQNFINKPPPASLPGVRALYLRFFRRELYQIEVFYEEKNNLPSLAEFVQDLSANLKLSTSEWKYSKGQAVVDCQQFSIVADKVLNPRAQITDTVMQNAFEKEEQQKNKSGKK